MKILLGKDLLPGSHGCWQHSVACRKSDWGLQFFAGTLNSLSHGPLHRITHNITACFIQLARKCIPTSKMDATILHNNHESDTLSPLPYFIRGKLPVSPSYTQSEGIYTWM